MIQFVDETLCRTYKEKRILNRIVKLSGEFPGRVMPLHRTAKYLKISPDRLSKAIIAQGWETGTAEFLGKTVKAFRVR